MFILITIDIINIFSIFILLCVGVFIVYSVIYFVYSFYVWLYAHFINDVVHKIKELNNK